MEKQNEIKPVKRLNTTLPDPLALYVAGITGKGALYETPSEFIRDLVRRHMEKTYVEERREIESMLAQSLAENSYTPWSNADLEDARKAITE